MASVLPRFISLGYHGKYLECVNGEGDSKGLIVISGEDALSPKARFEVEKALCSKEPVHLKCCYRNKYLRRKSEEDDTIVAIASDPEEDQSKWSCTLFRPRLVQFESTELQDDICGEFVFEIMAPTPSKDGGPYYLFSATEEAHQSYLKISTRTTALSVRNTQAVVQLPRYFLLKAENGKYARRRVVHGVQPYSIGFTVEEDDYMDAAVFVVTTLGDGSVRLSLYQVTPSFLQFDGSDDFIRPSLWSGDANDNRSRFLPVKLGTSANSFGLRVLSNNRLCKLDPGPITGITDFLSATSSQVEAAAVLEFEEAVSSRSIYQINYRMDDAKIYDFAPVTSVTKDVNNESQTTQAGELAFTYTETKSETWGNMDSWGVGVTVEMKVRIPFVGSTEISTGAEYDGEYQWGEAKETSTEVGTTLELEVPPMSRTQVTMIVSRGTLEVPFSYVQRDTLYTGQAVVTELDGGVFTGVNTYVSYETTEIK